MRNFDPMKTRKDMGLKPLPSWLSSLSEQRAMLAAKGLHEVTTSNDRGVWATVEKVKLSGSDSPTLFNGIDVRGDRKSFEDGINYCYQSDPSPDVDKVTLREKEKNENYIASKFKAVRV